MSTHLSLLVSEYVTIRPQSRQSEYLLRRTVALFEQHLKRMAFTDDLTDIVVSSFLRWLETRCAAWTAHGNRTRLLSLWRYAAKRGLCDMPGEVRREPAPEPMPVAWTVDQVGALVNAAILIPNAEYWRALVLVCYESGLRRSDVWKLHRLDVSPDGAIRIRQHKTGYPHEPRLRPATARLVLSLPGQRPLARPCGIKQFYASWRKLCELAGVPHGAMQQLRRTGATWVAERDGMDAARRFLGHRSPEMVYHYVDRLISASPAPIPPALPSAI